MMHHAQGNYTGKADQEKRRFRGLPEKAANKHYQNIADKQKERARHENTIQNPGKRRGGDP